MHWGKQWDNVMRVRIDDPPGLCPESYLLLQVLSDAVPDPGFAAKRRSQPPRVHISVTDEVSTGATGADPLSCAGDTLNRNCVCAVWPFS